MSGLLDSKVVLITGGAHGMGRATANRCGELGASVVAVDLNGEGVASVAAGIEADGGAAIAVTADLTLEDEVQAMIDAAIDRFGRIDGLHNNAYAIHAGARADLANTTLEGWDWTIRTCLTSQFLCCRAVIPHMVRQGGGAIVNVSSGNGLAGGPRLAAYGVAKAGTIALTKYVATQYGKLGVRCNSIVPGWTLTFEGEEFTPELQERYARGLPDVCMPRLAEPEDVARIVALLMSDDAAYLQGATIDVNGGLLAHLPGSAGMPPSEDEARGLLNT